MNAAVALVLGTGAIGHAQRAALGVLAVRIAGAGLAYGTQVLLARLMGAAEYGVFATVWVLLTIAGHGATWGFAVAVCRFVPEHRARGERELARGFVSGGAILVAASALAIAALGALGLWLGRGLLGPSYVGPLALALLVLPLFALQDYAEGVARSFTWTALAIAPPYIVRQALLMLGMVGAVLSGAPAEPWVAMLVTLAATALVLAGQTFALRHRIRRELGSGATARRWRAWIATAWPISFVDLTALGLSYVDILVLTLFAPPEVVGLYFAATRLLQLAMFVPYAASAATAQRFSDLGTRGDREALAALVARSARVTAVATVGTGLLLVLAGPVLLGLFGEGFRDSWPILAILVAGVAGRTLFGPAEDLLTMLGEERICAVLAFAFLIVAIVLNLTLVPLFGVLGAAGATAATGTGLGVALMVAARRRLGLATHVLAR